MRIETFVYAHAQVVELFLDLLTILGSIFYSLPIFWIVNDMYFIYLFPDVTHCCGRVSYGFQHRERRDVGRNGGFRDEMRVRDGSRGGKRLRKRDVGQKRALKTRLRGCGRQREVENKGKTGSVRRR